MSVVLATGLKQTIDLATGEIIDESPAESQLADVGLSTSHIFPQSDQETDAVDPSSRAEFWVGGSLASARRVTVGDQEQKGGGVRSAITTFTPGSRRRLMRTIAKLRRNSFPVFVTLTYPGEFAGDPVQWKRDLKVLWQRLERKFPRAGFVWRLEFQKRGAPHYHLLIWGVSYQNLRDWISQTWYEVVGSGDERHLRAGTRVEVIRSWKHVMRYASKELGKVDQAKLPCKHVGRWWGVYGRGLLPWADLVVLFLADEQAVQVIRWMRRFARIQARAYKSLTVFCDGTFWAEKIRAGPNASGPGFLEWSRQFV